ncbi:hypothetical protein MCERE19_03176 [Spirosomataceae bacterium]
MNNENLSSFFAYLLMLVLLIWWYRKWRNHYLKMNSLKKMSPIGKTREIRFYVLIFVFGVITCTYLIKLIFNI